MKQFLFSSLALAGALLLGTSSAPAAETYEPGKHYELVEPAQPTRTPGKVEVLELFWYGCPHCYELEPVIAEWLPRKPEAAEFRRMPALFNQAWMPAAKAFFAAEVLGISERMHPRIFEAIHRERRKLNTDPALTAFFAAEGVPEAEYKGVIESFAVQGKVNDAMLMTRNYGVSGVPAIIVNGKYRTSAGMAGSYEAMLKVAEWLVAKEQEAGAVAP